MMVKYAMSTFIRVSLLNVLIRPLEVLSFGFKTFVGPIVWYLEGDGKKSKKKKQKKQQKKPTDSCGHTMCCLRDTWSELGWEDYCGEASRNM